jgi:hypothetical protein
MKTEEIGAGLIPIGLKSLGARETWAKMAKATSLSGVLGLLGGIGISIGAWLPWMSLYAGLVSLRGLIGLNGRLLLAAGLLGVALGIILARENSRGYHVAARRLAAALGVGVIGASTWLFVGVWHLSHGRGASAMLIPRAGPGLFVVTLGGVLLVLAAYVPEGLKGFARPEPTDRLN